MSSRNDPSISIAPSGNFALRFTNDSGDYSHSIEIPAGDNGLRLIRTILIARNSGSTKLGQMGNPTQDVIRAWLANKYETDAITKKQELETDLNELSEMF